MTKYLSIQYTSPATIEIGLNEKSYEAIQRLSVFDLEEYGKLLLKMNNVNFDEESIIVDLIDTEVGK